MEESGKSCGMEKSSCATKSCGAKCCVLSFFAIFLTIFAFDWLFHGVLMMPSYIATASLWRSEAEMQQYFYITIIRHIVSAAIFTCMLCCVTCKSTNGACGTMKPIKIGAKLGILVGIASFASYAYMPIPMDMAIAWLAGETVKGALAGMVFLFVSRCKKSKG
jgi:hypothetical protein